MDSHMLYTVLLPIRPNLVNEGMMKEKLRSIGWGDSTHISSHSAVNCVMEVDSKIELKHIKTHVRRLMELSQIDGYYVGR